MRITFFVIALTLAGGCTEDVAPTPTAVTEEPPYFVTDNNATGPLTMEELNINIPDRIDARLSDQERACVLAAIERRAKEAGDPRNLNVDAGPYQTDVLNQAQWDDLQPYQQRIMLAQRVVHGAFREC